MNTVFDGPLMTKKNKRRQIKRIAADYLSNITLNGLLDNTTKHEYYEKIISNDFDCFLAFHKIKRKREDQTEFFNYYKSSVVNRDEEQSNNLQNFLYIEFNNFDETNELDNSKIYIENILDRKTRLKIPEIKILPSISFDNHNLSSDSKLKLSLSDNDCDTNQKKNMLHTKFTSSNTTVGSHNLDKPTKQKSNSMISNKMQSLINPKKSKRSSLSIEAENSSKDCKIESVDKLMKINESTSSHRKDVLSQSTNSYLNPRITFPKNDKRIRAISESSTESNLSSSLNSNSNILSARNFRTCRPTLFNNLKKLTNEKLILTSNNIPISVFSRLAFRSNAFKSDLNDSFKNSIPKSSQGFISDVFELFDLDFDEFIRKGEMSYENLIDPATLQAKQRNIFKRVNTIEETRLKDFHSEDENTDDPRERDENCRKESFVNLNIPAYVPDYLDDPQLTELTAGKNRTCLKFTSYAVSIIDYVKPLDLKKEINETFKEKFPHIQISLTKLRSIKREILEIAVECMIDIIIVAQAYVYFERLILQGLINKPNRKYLAGNCLLIAAKLNDVTKKDITRLLEVIITKFRFDNKKELISYEFGILVALEFNLLIKHQSDFESHYERLKNNTENNKILSKIFMIAET